MMCYVFTTKIILYIMYYSYIQSLQYRLATTTENIISS